MENSVSLLMFPLRPSRCLKGSLLEMLINAWVLDQRDPLILRSMCFSPELIGRNWRGKRLIRLSSQRLRVRLISAKSTLLSLKKSLKIHWWRTLLATLCPKRTTSTALLLLLPQQWKALHKHPCDCTYTLLVLTFG